MGGSTVVPLQNTLIQSHLTGSFPVATVQPVSTMSRRGPSDRCSVLSSFLNPRLSLIQNLSSQTTGSLFLHLSCLSLLQPHMKYFCPLQITNQRCRLQKRPWAIGFFISVFLERPLERKFRQGHVCRLFLYPKLEKGEGH